MAVIEGGTSGSLMEVGLASGVAGHVTLKPIPHGTGGHYRTNHRAAIVASQAANSRLFEFRNSSSGLLIPTRLNIRVIQTGNFTANIEDSFDVFKVTSFTAVDTTNTVTPTASVKKNGMLATPGNAAIRGVTVAGAAAGMTGGTLTKDTTSVGSLPVMFYATFSTTAPPSGPFFIDNFDDVNGTYPFVFGQNEGFIIENRVLLGVAASATIYIDLAWAEVANF